MKDIISKQEVTEKLETQRATQGEHCGVITKMIGDVNEILGPGGMLNNEQLTQLDLLNSLLNNKMQFYCHVSKL